MKTFRMIATSLLMVVLCLNFAACSDDNPGPNDAPNGGVQNVELPFSDAAAPIVSGKMIVVRGNGFTEGCEIWLQTSSAKSNDVKAEVISYSDESISFIAPRMSGSCDVILKQDGEVQVLGSIYLEHRNPDNLEEYTYAIAYKGEGESFPPLLYLYDSRNEGFQLKASLPQGEIIKFALPENCGNGHVYYFKIKRSSNDKEVSLYEYNIKTGIENTVCTGWLHKFSGASSGMAIGMIENTLCGLEASIDNGFEIVAFANDGKTTLLKKAFPYAEINGKRVVQFYCEDDNLLFSYDSEKRCVLVTGKIRFEDDPETFDCLLSFRATASKFQ